MIETDLMRMLIAVGDAGGLGRAGESLGLSQQAISAQLKRLEGMVGRRLVERGARGSQLTDAGETLIGYARRAVALEDEVRRHFAEVKVSGDLRIGVSEGFAPAGLPIILRALDLVQPELRISVLTGRTPTLEAAIDNGAVELVIGLQRAGEGRGEALLSDRVRWMGDPEPLRDPAAVVRLAAHPSPSILRSMMADALAAAGRVHAVVFESESQSSLRAAAVAGIAVGCHVFERLGGDDAFGTGVLPPIGDAEIYVRRRPSSGAPAEALVEVLRKEADHLLSPGPR